MHHRPSKPWARIIVAFGVFVALLCGLLYVGFNVKFTIDPDQKGARRTAQKEALPDPLFYKSVGHVSKSQTKSNKQEPFGARYTLEFAVVRKRDLAERAVDRLIDKGVQAFYTPLQNQGRVVYRIRRGVFDSESAARKEATKLAKAKQLKPRIVKLR